MCKDATPSTLRCHRQISLSSPLAPHAVLLMTSLITGPPICTSRLEMAATSVSRRFPTGMIGLSRRTSDHHGWYTIVANTAHHTEIGTFSTTGSPPRQTVARLSTTSQTDRARSQPSNRCVLGPPGYPYPGLKCTNTNNRLSGLPHALRRCCQAIQDWNGTEVSELLPLLHRSELRRRQRVPMC